MLFWALRKDLVLEVPVPPGKGGALAPTLALAAESGPLPGRPVLQLCQLLPPHLCMSHRPWLEGAGGRGPPLFTGHASTLPGEGTVVKTGRWVGWGGGWGGEVGGGGGREGTSSLSEVTRRYSPTPKRPELIKHPSVLT